MKRFQYSINIDAPKEKVWDVLWNNHTYREWTALFHEGSEAKTDWKEGSPVLFLADGEGMYSEIVRNIPNTFMSFRHLGVVKNGVEQPMDEETSQWSGAMEDYTLKESNGHTELTIDMDVTDSYEVYFRDTYPKAFAKVKELSER